MLPAGLLAAAPAGAPVQTYYIAAERSVWNFAPHGLVDNCTGEKLVDDQLVRTIPYSESYPSLPCPHHRHLYLWFFHLLNVLKSRCMGAGLGERLLRAPRLVSGEVLWQVERCSCGAQQM